MKPIINPWLFYLVDMIGSFQILSILIVLLIIISFAIEIVKYDEDIDELDKVKIIKTFKKKVIVIITIMIDDLKPNKEKELKSYRRTRKIVILFSILLLIVIPFIPSKETCYKMMVSSQITDTNIQKAEDVIKSSVDYIFEKINER